MSQKFQHITHETHNTSTTKPLLKKIFISKLFISKCFISLCMSAVFTFNTKAPTVTESLSEEVIASIKSRKATTEHKLSVNQLGNILVKLPAFAKHREIRIALAQAQTIEQHKNIVSQFFPIFDYKAPYEPLKYDTLLNRLSHSAYDSCFIPIDHLLMLFLESDKYAAEYLEFIKNHPTNWNTASLGNPITFIPAIYVSPDLEVRIRETSEYTSVNQQSQTPTENTNIETKPHSIKHSNANSTESQKQAETQTTALKALDKNSPSKQQSKTLERDNEDQTIPPHILATHSIKIKNDPITTRLERMDSKTEIYYAKQKWPVWASGAKYYFAQATQKGTVESINASYKQHTSRPYDKLLDDVHLNNLDFNLFIIASMANFYKALMNESLPDEMQGSHAEFLCFHSWLIPAYKELIGNHPECMDISAYELAKQLGE